MPGVRGGFAGGTPRCRGVRCSSRRSLGCGEGFPAVVVPAGAGRARGAAAGLSSPPVSSRVSSHLLCPLCCSVAGCPSHLPSPPARPAPHLRTLGRAPPPLALARFPGQGPGAAQPRRGGCPGAPRPLPCCTGPRAGAEAISDTVTVTPRRPPRGPEPSGPLRGGLGPLAPCPPPQGRCPARCRGSAATSTAPLLLRPLSSPRVHRSCYCCAPIIIIIILITQFCFCMTR